MKKRFKFIKHSLLAICTAASAFSIALAQVDNQQPNPGFGLVWGSKSEIESMGVLLSKYEADTLANAYTATNLPKTVRDVETTLLIFDDAQELIKIVAISSTFHNDYYGTSVKARTEEISIALEKNYGVKPEKFARTDKYYGGDDYAHGIYSKKNSYILFFSTNACDIGVQIDASSLRDLYYKLTYERKPHFSNYMEKLKTAESEAF